jgi:RimJ/RimL family protein N-acetyltransferase
MQRQDLDGLLEIFGDPTVMAAFAAEPFDRADMLRWIERNLAHQESHGYGLFSVVLKASGRIIGDCGLEHRLVRGAPEVELGYDFRSACWNRGYATEAAAAVRDYAFRDLQLGRLVSLIRSANGVSKRVAEKIGMARESDFVENGVAYSLYALACDGRV